MKAGLRTFIDQMGREVRIAYPPRRIISLVPSQTELLYDLGLGANVVGVTKFCIHPADKSFSPLKIGGTKTADIEKIIGLNPDLIIGNKEENDQGQIEALAQRAPVWMSNIADLNGALDMIRSVSGLTGKMREGQILTGKISTGFDDLEKHRVYGKVLYLIWKKPWMAAGSNTFISDILNRCGLENAAQASRYPEISEVDLPRIYADFVFLSSEPFPFKEMHIAEISRLMPSAKVILVDGEYFSWYGSHLQYAPAYFRKLIKELQ